MPKLNLDLLKKLNLTELDSVEAVRRQGQAYALNTKGQLIAVSATKTDLAELSIGAECSDLEHLYLAYNPHLFEIEFEVELPKLVHLYLNNCALQLLQLPANLPSLQQLYVQKNQLYELAFKEACPALQLLDASENQLQIFDLPIGFTSLAYLYLQKNQIEDLLTWSVLPGLNILDLQGNLLTELPLQLVQCTRLEALYIHDNPLSRFKKDVLNYNGDKNSWEGVRNYLSSLVKDEVEEYDQVKLIVLGNSTAGKTSLVHFLKDRTYLKSRDSTHGMVPIIWNLDATCKVAVWDFGGQEYYHNIHHLFFTDQCLYLVVFEQKTNTNGTLPTEIKIFGHDDPITEDLEHFHYSYWLDNIRYLTQKLGDDKAVLEVVKVQNKFDLPPEQKIAGADYHISVEKAHEALNGQQETQEDTYWLDFRSFEIRLKQKLQQIRGQVPVSTKWLKIKDEVQKKALSGVPLMSRGELVKLAESIKGDIDKKTKRQGKSELDTLLDTFTKSGVVLYYPEIDPERIFINPAWLADAIYHILNYEVKKQDGKFSLHHVEAVLANWRREDKFTLEAQELIALMRELDLIYELNPEFNPEECKDGNRVFIAPQYLPLGCPEPKNIKRFKEQCQDAGLGPYFSLFYPTFLPKSTMPRFIARYGHWANQPCWRYGIIYERQGMEVLVECHFEEKTIHFWIKPLEQKPELVREIFENFQQLNDQNPEVQISRNQADFVRIGTLLKHPFGENSKIETVKGTLLEAKDFAEFVGFAEFGRKDIVSPSTNHKVMYGVEKQIEGYQKDIDGLIEKKNFFQEELKKAYDVGKKFSLKEEIESLEEEIEKCRRKIESLLDRSGARIESAQSSSLQDLLVKTNQLSADVGTINQKLDEGFQSIITHLSAQDQQLLAILQSSEATHRELAQYFLELDQKSTNPYEMELIIGRIDTMIADHIVDLPEAIIQQWKALNAKSPEYTDVKGKLKLKIPILPAILNLEYETEASWDWRNIAKQIWADLKAGKVFLK